MKLDELIRDGVVTDQAELARTVHARLTRFICRRPSDFGHNGKRFRPLARRASTRSSSLFCQLTPRSGGPFLVDKVAQFPMATDTEADNQSQILFLATFELGRQSLTEK